MEPTATERVIATFADEQRADRAIRTLRDRGVGPDAIRLDDPDDKALLARQSQRREAASVAVGPGVIGERRSMAAGWLHTLTWGAVGAVVGAVVGALVDLGDMSEVAEVVLLAVIGALALGTAGFVFGLGRGPEAKPGPAPDVHHSIVSIDLTGTRTDVVDVLRGQGPVDLWSAGAGELRTIHDQRVGRLP